MAENPAPNHCPKCVTSQRASATSQNSAGAAARLIALFTLPLIAGCHPSNPKVPKPTLAPRVTLACEANPSGPIFPGDPLIVSATAGDLNPNLITTYTWSGPGVTGNGNIATVATNSLAPGTYTATATVTQVKPSQKAPKPGQVATCSARFTVRPFDSPSLSCYPSWTTLKPGDTTIVTAIGVSPQNRPLTYSYLATAGSISGDSSTATYSSAGAPTGSVGITCSVRDDHGHTATAQTSLNIIAPAAPPAPLSCSATVCAGYAKLQVDPEFLSPRDQVSWSFPEDPGRLQQGYGSGRVETGNLPNGMHSFQAEVRSGAFVRQCQGTFQIGPPPQQCDQNGDLSWVVAMLPQGQHEHFGFKMHIYVLARKRPQSTEEIQRLHNIVKSVLGRGDLVSQGNELAPQPDSVSTPATVPTHAEAAVQASAEKKGEIAIPVTEPFPGCGNNPPQLQDCTDDGKASWVVEKGKFDPTGAVELMRALACEQPNATPSCRNLLAGNGPFLVATLNTLSFSPSDSQHYRTHPRPLLIWDLSANSPDEAYVWTDKFLLITANPANWSGNTVATRTYSMAQKLAQLGFVCQRVGDARDLFYKIAGIKPEN